MKKLNYYKAETENNQIILKFKIPYYSEIQKIEFRPRRSSDPEYWALVLEDDTFANLELKNLTKIEIYQAVGINQELDHSFGRNLTIVSRLDYNGRDFGDVYLFRKYES